MTDNTNVTGEDESNTIEVRYTSGVSGYAVNGKLIV